MKLIKCDSQIYEVCPFHYACGKGEDYAEESECDKFAEMALKRIVTDKDRRAADIISALQDENAKLRAELEQVKVERDAAINAIPHTCETCLFHAVTFNGCTPDHDCTNPDGGCSNNYDRWKWRGPTKENCR